MKQLYEKKDNSHIKELILIYFNKLQNRFQSNLHQDTVYHIIYSIVIWNFFFIKIYTCMHVSY